MGGIHAEALRRDEWDALVDAGLLDDQQVELLDGRKVAMSPEGPDHATIIDIVADQLRRGAAVAGLTVRVGHPVALSGIDEPEPDVCVVVGPMDRYRQEHPLPEDVRLAVEVSRTSLDKDLGLKLARYAAAGIEEYWVVDLDGQRTIVHRDPAGSLYRDVRSVAFGDPATPLALPDTSVTLR